MKSDDIRKHVKVEKAKVQEIDGSVAYQAVISADGKKYRAIRRCSAAASEAHGTLPPMKLEAALLDLCNLLDVGGVKPSDLGKSPPKKVSGSTVKKSKPKKKTAKK